MISQLEYKHTAPIESVKSLSEFLPQNVDKDLISHLSWNVKENSQSKVLVCHDMQGGYVDDKFINGTDNPESYNFYHWAQIDIFVYFSHHLVTIPPLVWINIAHKNGVLVLGTFITEWEKGADNCSTMFNSVESSIQFAKQLAEIAITYNFDGWLVNIENTLSLDEVSNIQVFLQVLSIELKARSSHSLVIWYDAVTSDGTLKWQDSVTDLNSCFLKCCDGIFLNYTWKDWQLQLTMELCLDRLSDVFVGIDVWARGCVGKFDCFQSIEKILSYGFSTALFAPAWCYEENNGNFSNFLKDNNKFWNLLQSTCPPKPLQSKACENIVSNFNFGFGKRIFEYGFLLCLKQWYNLSKQDSLFTNFSDNESYNIFINFEEAFDGSTSIEICFREVGLKQVSKLFCINAHVNKHNILTLVCKSNTKSNLTCLRLMLSDTHGVNQTLEQTSNFFTGGNGWRRISFESSLPCNVSWIGLQCNEIESSILIGHISICL